MKNLKKLAGIMLALVMVLAMAVPAFAATETGSITINNAVEGQTYDIYKMFDLEYNATTGAYLYKVTTEWKDFITTGYGKDYYQLNGDYVTFKDGAEIDNAPLIAKEALAYVKTVNADENPDNNISVAATLPKDGSYKATGLALGYYLVDSSLGALCGLTTTAKDATVNEKNGVPTNEKKVEENSTGKYGAENDAEIGQEMNFQSTVKAQEGAENYVFHDKMTNMDFKQVTGITSTHTDAEGTATTRTLTVDTDYVVKTKTTGGLKDTDCTFEVQFTQTFCDTLKDNDTIVISYTAILNKDAVIGNIINNKNTNESKLSYGQEGKTTSTTPSTTTTYTWDFDVFKYTTLNNVDTPLAGAEFTLSKNADGTSPISLVKVKDGSDADPHDVYRLAIEGETGVTKVEKIETNATGKFTIQGLDSGTYYLTETKAPAGYNLPANPTTPVVIDNTGKINANEQNPDGAHEIKILNQSGSELPSTGGIGTMIFYIVGGVLLVGAGVLLVVRKRMSAEKKSK